MNPTNDEIRALLLSGSESNTMRVDLARPLAEEVLRLRKLIVDLDLWGVNHKPLCNKSPWCSCDCGAEELQLRINEATP